MRQVGVNPFVTAAWGRGKSLSVHGWCYSIADGLVNDLETTVGSAEDVETLFG